MPEKGPDPSIWTLDLPRISPYMNTYAAPLGTRRGRGVFPPESKER